MNRGKAIRIARSIANLSQTELAKKVGLNRTYLSALESGSRPVTDQVIEDIAGTLDMSGELLLFLGIEPGDYQRGMMRKAVNLANYLLTR
jgi:transcriptional regulator with XRE-family HTH domain